MSKNEMVKINNIDVSFESKGNQWFSDTKSIADVFKKRPADILRAVRNFHDFDEQFTQRKIALSSYIDKTGRSNQKYLLNRDNHLILIMGLTGKNAFIWKREFINAFNKMESIILENKSIETKELEVMNKAFVPNLEEYGQISNITKKRRTQKRKGCFVSVGGAKMTNKEMDIIRREIALIEVEQSNIKDLSYRADELKALQEQVDNAQWKDTTPKAKRPTIESLQLENKLLRKKLSISESIVKMLRDEAKALFNQFVR